MRRRTRTRMRRRRGARMRRRSRRRVRAGSRSGSRCCRMRRGRLSGMRLRLMRLRIGRLAGSLGCRRRRFHRLVLMPARILRIMFGLPLRNHFVLHFRLVLNEFYVGNLRRRRRRHYKEKCQDKAGDHESEMEDVRAGSSFRHLNYIFGIYLPAVNHGGVVVSITHRIGYE